MKEINSDMNYLLMKDINNEIRPRLFNILSISTRNYIENSVRELIVNSAKIFIENTLQEMSNERN